MSRNTTNAWVAGVASGLADNYDAPVWAVRLFFVATFFVFGLGFFLYLWLWAGMPGSNNQIHINFQH